MRTLTIAILLLAPMTAGAQERDEKLAERLKAIVDLRLDELRAELRREIDLALGGRPPLGLVLKPASAEFRELHRLPEGCGLRVESVDAGGAGWMRLGLRREDVVLYVGTDARPSRWIKGAADIEAALSEAGDQWILPTAVVIRKGDRVVASGPEHYRSPGAGIPLPLDRFRLDWEKVQEIKPAETADQMLERLWNKALREAVPTGLDPLPVEKPVAESHPVENSLIPGQGGRR